MSLLTLSQWCDKWLNQHMQRVWLLPSTHNMCYLARLLLLDYNMLYS